AAKVMAQWTALETTDLAALSFAFTAARSVVSSAVHCAITFAAFARAAAIALICTVVGVTSAPCSEFITLLNDPLTLASVSAAGAAPPPPLPPRPPPRPWDADAGGAP